MNAKNPESHTGIKFRRPKLASSTSTVTTNLTKLKNDVLTQPSSSGMQSDDMKKTNANSAICSTDIKKLEKEKLMNVKNPESHMGMKFKRPKLTASANTVTTSLTKLRNDVLTQPSSSGMKSEFMKKTTAKSAMCSTDVNKLEKEKIKAPGHGGIPFIRNTRKQKSKFDSSNVQTTVKGHTKPNEKETKINPEVQNKKVPVEKSTKTQIKKPEPTGIATPNTEISSIDQLIRKSKPVGHSGLPFIRKSPNTVPRCPNLSSPQITRAKKVNYTKTIKGEK